MNRDELQEKAWQAWLAAPSARHGVNAVVEVAEPIIRADERDKRDAYWLLGHTWVDGLRAKVEALRHEDECDVSRGRERPETGMAECNCLRADVLALLPDARHREGDGAE